MGKKLYPGTVHRKQLETALPQRKIDACLVMFFEAIDRARKKVEEFDRIDFEFPEYLYPIKDRGEWHQEVRDYVETAAWFHSLDSEGRDRASQIQVVRDLYRDVFPHYGQERYREAIQKWRSGYGLDLWDKIVEPSLPGNRFYCWIENLLIAWQTQDNLDTSNPSGNEIHQFARIARTTFYWGPFFCNTLDEPRILAANLGPTAPVIEAAAAHPRFECTDDFEGWDEKLQHYADRVEKAAEDAGIVEPRRGSHNLLRDFEWLVRRTVYRETPEMIAKSVNLLGTGGDSAETIREASKKAADLIGLKFRRGRPPKSRK